MNVGDLVQWTRTAFRAPRLGVVVDIDSGEARMGALEDQATIQIMWSDMRLRWECPLDIEVISEGR